MLPLGGTYHSLLAQWEEGLTMTHIHELRDPIHVFIRVDDNERDVVNSPHFQRLRHIHQLALTYLLYPGGNPQTI